MSRATDETGYVQPTFDVLLAARGPSTAYHFNHIRAWKVMADGAVKFAGAGGMKTNVDVQTAVLAIVLIVLAIVPLRAQKPFGIGRAANSGRDQEDRHRCAAGRRGIA
jgi:hypothetical protein